MISKSLFSLNIEELLLLNLLTYVLTILSFLHLKGSYKKQKSIETQNREATFFGRMMIANTASLAIVLLSVIESQVIKAILGIVVCVLAIIAIAKIETLSIWEEE